MARLFRTFLLVLAVTAGTALAMAQDFASPSEARAMLDKASAYLEAHGPEEAARAFMDRSGPFRDRDLYVSMFRADDGIRLAHAYPRMIGRSLVESVDADGLPYGRMLLEMAAKQNSGSLDYKILNPLTGTPMVKTGFLRKVDGIILVVGAYR
jgi:hypothetical protein